MTDDPDDASASEPAADYDPRVNSQRCIGCGLCADMMGEVFGLNDDKFGIAYVHDRDAWRDGPDGQVLLEETAKNCPVAAIVLDPTTDIGPDGMPADNDHDPTSDAPIPDGEGGR